MVGSIDTNADVALSVEAIELSEKSWDGRTPGAVDINDYKSPNDRKVYRHLFLSNQMEVVLIKQVVDNDSDDDCDDASSSCSSSSSSSDDEEEHDHMAAVALSVGVGSFSDPVEYQGLAHYLEHMLFMGSTKYPDENEFEAFLSSHGGYSNGMTENETTYYNFEVGPAFLQKALDYFAQFFISPLFRKDAMDRELQAVDSEFHQARSSDGVRLKQLLAHTADTSHPFHGFGWGNAKSLESQQDDSLDIREAMMSFYNSHYSANVMKLVVQSSKHSLDDMELFVTESFSKVENKNLSPIRFVTTLPSPPPCWKTNIRYDIIPVRDIHSLNMHFTTPLVTGLHRQSPYSTLAHLIGHEGKGSILHILKRNGWANDLYAGIDLTDGYENATFGSVFCINVSLTTNGVDRVNDIVRLIFEYIYLLTRDGIPDWIFKELVAISQKEFRYLEEADDPSDFVQEVSRILQDRYEIPLEDILRTDLLSSHEVFDEELVMSFVKRLTVDNLRLDVASPLLEDKTNNNWEIEPWFEVKYRVVEIPLQVLNSWKEVGLNADLALPAQNPFLSVDDKFYMTSTTNVPTKIESNGCMELWYKFDSSFKLPKVNANFTMKVLPNLLLQCPENFAMAQLFIMCVKDVLTEPAYHAYLADIHYSLKLLFVGDCHYTGGAIELKFSGFTSKIQHFATVVLDVMSQGTFTKDRFIIMKEQLCRAYHNAIITSEKKAKYMRLQLLQKSCFSIESLRSAAESSIDFEDFTAFMKNFRAVQNLTGFIHGNLLCEDAVDFATTVKDRLKVLVRNNSTPSDDNVIIEIPPGTNGLWSLPSDHADEVNTAVQSYYQVSENNQSRVLTAAYCDLLQQMMEEPLFDTLRTKEQLGYSVHCISHETSGKVLGFSVSVVSSMFTAQHVTARINHFLLETFTQYLAQLSQEDFQDHVNAQIQHYLLPDNNLGEETSRHWHEIKFHRQEFNRSTTLANLLKSGAVTQSELLRLYQEWITSSTDARHITVQVVPVKAPAPEDSGDYDVITDAQSFKKTLKL